MEIPGTKRFISKGFELATPFLQKKRELKMDTFLTLMETRSMWVNLTIEVMDSWLKQSLRRQEPRRKSVFNLSIILAGFSTVL